VAVPPSKPTRPGKTPGAGARDSFPADNNYPTSNVRPIFRDDPTIASLKELVAAGEQRLDTMLGSITDAARQLSGASGAALAMWKEGAMVCRARSGETAPALGARLSADSGISGECLRSGEIQNCSDTENDPRVDFEVCRRLGLRSIAVLPIQGWRGINGILEVFSTAPAAFSSHHISLLQQLTALAERARASQPHGASAATPRVSPQSSKPKPSGLLPASDRVGDVALAFVGRKSRPFVLGGIAVAAIALIALMVWLGWRGPSESSGKAHAASSLSAASSAAASSVTVHPPDNDPVWKPDPGGETLLLSVGKPSAGSPVTFASKTDTLPEISRGNAKHVDKQPLDVESEAAGTSISIERYVVQPKDAAAVEPPSITDNSATANAISGVLTAKASLPALAVPVSQGVSGGQLVRRESPAYPAQARLLRQEGKVVLSAVVMEDGSVREVKVVEGPAVFAQSAVDAVKHWRYKPYELDGKPVKNEIRINIDFKLPTESATR